MPCFTSGYFLEGKDRLVIVKHLFSRLADPQVYANQALAASTALWPGHLKLSVLIAPCPRCQNSVVYLLARVL
jgi:hypothetical protein